MPDQPANITAPAPDPALLASGQWEVEHAEAPRTDAATDQVMPVQLRLDETHPSDAALVRVAGVDLTHDVAGLTVTAGPGLVTTLTLELQLRPVDVDGRMRVDIGPDTAKVLRAAGWTPPGKPRTRRLPDGHPLGSGEARQQWAVVAITDDHLREQVLSLHPTHTAAQDSAITQALAKHPELDTPYHNLADISWIHRPDRGRSKLRIAATAPGFHVVLVEPVPGGYRTTDGFIPAGPCSGPVPLPEVLRDAQWYIEINGQRRPEPYADYAAATASAEAIIRPPDADCPSEIRWHPADVIREQGVRAAFVSADNAGYIGVHVVLVEPAPGDYRTQDGFITVAQNGHITLPEVLRAQGGEIARLVDRTEELWQSRKDPASGEAAAG